MTEKRATPRRRAQGRVRRGLDATLRDPVMGDAPAALVGLARSLADATDAAAECFIRDATRGKDARGDAPSSMSLARCTSELREVLGLLGVRRDRVPPVDEATAFERELSALLRNAPDL